MCSYQSAFRNLQSSIERSALARKTRRESTIPEEDLTDALLSPTIPVKMNTPEVAEGLPLVRLILERNRQGQSTAIAFLPLPVFGSLVIPGAQKHPGAERAAEASNKIERVFVVHSRSHR